MGPAAVAIFQAREGGDLDLGGSSEGGEKSDLEFLWTGEPTELSVRSPSWVQSLRPKLGEDKFAMY